MKVLRPRDMRFFGYRAWARDKIRFRLVRDAAGQLKAAFDACQRCYIFRKGYVRSGGDPACRYGGNHYRLEAVESGLTSCVPVKLPIQAVGQTVNIKPADLERARGLF